MDQLAEIRRQRAAAFQTQKKEENYKRALEKASEVVLQGLVLQSQFISCPWFGWMDSSHLEKAVLWAGPLLVKTIRRRFIFTRDPTLFAFSNHVIMKMDQVQEHLETVWDRWRYRNRIHKNDLLRNIVVVDDARTLMLRHSEGIYAENQPKASAENRMTSLRLQQFKDLEEEKLASFGVHVVWLTDVLFDQWWEQSERMHSKQPYLTVEITKGLQTHYAMVANPSLPNEIVGNIRHGHCVVTPELFALFGMENTLTKQEREAVVTCCIPPMISDSARKGVVLQPQTEQDLTCFVSSVQEYEMILQNHLQKHRLLYKGQIIYVYPPHDVICIPYKVVELFARDGSSHQVVSIFNQDVGIDFLPFTHV